MAKIMNGFKKSLVGIVVGVAGLAASASGAMVETRVADFKDILAITHPGAVAGNVSTGWGNFTSDYADPSTGDLYKVKTGFINNLGAYCGYANSSSFVGLGNILAGKYLSSADGNPWGLANGERPISAVSIIDVANDGIGIWKYDDSNPRKGGELTMDDEDSLVYSNGHVINGVAGDFSNLPTLDGANRSLGTWHITPEPATMGLLALGGSLIGLKGTRRRNKKTQYDKSGMIDY